MRGAEALPGPVCLVSCPLSYNGRGWPQTCVNIVAQFPQAGLKPVMLVPRATRPLSPALNPVQAMPPVVSLAPWRFSAPLGHTLHEWRFSRMLRGADPSRTIAYFWPGTSIDLVRQARARGILTIREMINTYQGTARRILDQAYASHGLASSCSIQAADVELEREELQLYDHIFAPAPLVEESLLEAGVPRGRIVPTSFGWPSARFDGVARKRPQDAPLRVVFVGIVGVRKGVPELLAAWRGSNPGAELLLVGNVEPALQPQLAEALRDPSISHMPFTDNIGQVFRDADIFVFPTHEEGAPQVTFEAASCGLPAVTTPMGAARLVQDGRNGLIVQAGDVGALRAALSRICRDHGLRVRLAAQAEKDAALFTYEKVGAKRARIMIELLRSRQDSFRKAG